MKTLLSAFASSIPIPLSIPILTSSSTTTSSTSPLNGRPTLVSKDKPTIRAILTAAGTKPCTCDTHTPTHYYDYPVSCHTEHQPSDLVVLPDRRPLLHDRDVPHRHPFNALFLARACVKTFAREEADMDPRQQNGMTLFRAKVGEDAMMERLNEEDCRRVLDEGYMFEVVRDLCEIFFFGEHIVDGFRWGKGEDGISVLPVPAYPVPTILSIHPQHYDKSVSMTRASQRLGAILHDLTRIFLLKTACAQCKFAFIENVNKHGRGRAWHIIAKGIEEAGPQLLGVKDVGLRRFACLVADVEDGVETASRHDLEVYGFAELLEVEE